MAKSTATSVGGYLAGLSPEQRVAIEAVRAVVARGYRGKERVLRPERRRG